MAETSFDSESMVSETTDDDVTVSDYHEQLQLEDMEATRLQEHAAAIRQYVAAAEAETREMEVDSDEERDILLDIRAEITRQVREEMAGELARYRGTSLPGPLAAADGEGEAQDTSRSDACLEGIDPKLRDAILQMRKLDKVLLRKMRKEREVKRDRVQLEQNLREDLRQLDERASSEGSKVAKDIRNNTLKFLALKPPPKHNAGIFSEDFPEPTPVFQTEYLGGDTKAENNSSTGGDSSRRSPGKKAAGPGSGAKGAQGSPEHGGGRGRPAKDFIRRNIELAGAAGETVAMTEEERLRLDALLEDLDAIPTSFEAATEDTSSANPFQVGVRPGDGYSLDADSRSRMDAIDSRLRSLLPEDDFEALVTPSVRSESVFTAQSSFSPFIVDANLDLDRLGEPALQEVRDERDLRQRLDSVQSGLERLAVDAQEEVPQPYFARTDLEDLLGQCARSLSRSEAASTARSAAVVSEASADVSEASAARSEIQELMENPPRLEPDVLQRLLQQARDSGIGRHLPALEEAPEEAEQDEEERWASPRHRLAIDDYDEEEEEVTPRPNGLDSATTTSWTNGGLSSDRVTTPTSRPSSVRSSIPPLPTPTAVTPGRAAPVTPKEERLVLPDIDLYSQLTGPKRHG